MLKDYNNRGIAYIDTQQYDLSLADFTKFIKLDLKNGKAYNNRAITHWYTGKMEQTRRDVQKARSLGIAANPEFLKVIQEKAPLTQ
jgi:lipoprotein NlpI